MLTIFALPKGFSGHTAVIQRNALLSWTLLKPAPEIILLGDDPGVADAAREHKVKFYPDVARNALGTPLVSDLFSKAQGAAANDILCYANSDIIFMDDLMDSVSTVARWRRPFLVVGQRWNLDVEEALAFRPGWDEALRARARAEGELPGEWWIDYFIFPKGLWPEMPAFAIGRPVWDNWLVYQARRRGIPVVDATLSITAVHQNHGYAHVPRGTGHYWMGPESDENRRLAGGADCAFTIFDATHRLTDGRIRRDLSLRRLRRELRRLTARAAPRSMWRA